MLNLNGHTITGSIEISYPATNVYVRNGSIVGGVMMESDCCFLDGLNISVQANGIPVVIEFGNYNQVRNCVLSEVAPSPQSGYAVFLLNRTSYNIIQNNTFKGIFGNTIIEDDQRAVDTVVGDNSFSGNRFANPTP
jgi:hypothetical protein